MQEQSQKKAADLERQLAGMQRELAERDAEVAALKRAQQGAVEQQAAMVGDAVSAAPLPCCYQQSMCEMDAPE